MPKLTEAQAREILASSDKGIDLAAKYEVSPSTISAIRRGLLYPQLGLPVAKAHVKTPRDKLTPEAVREIRQSNESLIKLAKRFNVAYNTAYLAKKKITWKTVK